MLDVMRANEEGTRRDLDSEFLGQRVEGLSQVFTLAGGQWLHSALLVAEFGDTGPYEASLAESRSAIPAGGAQRGSIALCPPVLH